MEITFLLKGLVIGFSIAAPVGLIGVLCIRRTLADGRASGHASDLGAATADAVYGCIAGFGLTFVSSFLADQQTWLRLVGGVFLGSALWWLLLSGGFGMLRKKFNPAGLRWVNRISGAVITGFGVLALASAIW